MTESFENTRARLPSPSRDATEVLVALLSIKAILTIGKATFIITFTVKQHRKAPAEMSFSCEDSQRFSMRGLRAKLNQNSLFVLLRFLRAASRL